MDSIKLGIVGYAGSGKTNYLLNYIKQNSDKFKSIHIVHPYLGDEPLYTFLKDKYGNIINFHKNLSNLPIDELNESDLIVFDKNPKYNDDDLSKIIKCFESDCHCVVISHTIEEIPKRIKHLLDNIKICKQIICR
jgi:hypothetical protein